jgi:hypothetical protein
MLVLVRGTIAITFINLRYVVTLLYYYLLTSWFWPRVRARALRAPVFLGALPRLTGALRAPAHPSFAASYSSAKKYKFTISRN